MEVEPEMLRRPVLAGLAAWIPRSMQHTAQVAVAVAAVKMEPARAVQAVTAALMGLAAVVVEMALQTARPAQAGPGSSS